MRRTKESDSQKSKHGNGASLGFEEKLRAAVGKMRGHTAASERKHVALGVIFLNYISDAFQERSATLKSEPHADPEDRHEALLIRIRPHLGRVGYG